MNRFFVFAVAYAFITILNEESIFALPLTASDAKVGEFPWIAHIVSYFVGKDTYKPCTAALISKQWLLTSASCVLKLNETTNNYEEAESTLVRLGRYDLKASGETNEEVILSTEIHRHPNFDFALLKLPRPVAVTLQVQPISLPTEDSCSQKYTNNDGTVDKCSSGLLVGWGHNNVGKTEFLKKVNVDLQPFTSCKAAPFSESKLCTTATTSTCQVSDQGSPLACLQNGAVYSLIGIGNNATCNSTATSFGRVCSVLSWLSSYSIPTKLSGSNQGTLDLFDSNAHPIRLIGDNIGKGSRGFVEIYVNNTWGTVCSYGFTISEARIVCRQLGIDPKEGVSIMSQDAAKNLASSKEKPIWLHNVMCTGTESTLSDCNHAEWGGSDCDHSEDIAISCREEIENPQQANETAGIDGQVRLTGKNATMGFVEIYKSGQWGSVCDDFFTDVAAQVICNQLGLNTTRGHLLTPNEIAVVKKSKTTKIWLDDVACNGLEASLSECSHSTWGTTNCGKDEDVAISCLPNSLDGEIGRPGEVRLTGPTHTRNTGVVEIFWNGRWGTVCDDNFDEAAAQVVCRQLGLEGSKARTISTDRLKRSPGATIIWLDDVACTGQEVTLASCKHREWGLTDCIHLEDVAISCDGSSDSDEVNVTTGSIRLTGGSSNSTGIVEVFWGDRWGTVCDDFFDQAAAEVTCRQLGFGTSSATMVLSTGFKQSGQYQIWLDDVSCRGDEDLLVNCSHTDYGITNCGHYEDVAVSCSDNGAPVTTAVMMRDCDDGNIRLTGGSPGTNSSGFVEVCWGGQWGTVCDDNFDTPAAQVVCRQLGFGPSLATVMFSVGLMPSAQSRILLDDVTCSGNEDLLVNCSHNPFGVTNCGHYEDVAVSCSDSSAEITALVDPMENGTDGNIRLTGSNLKSLGFVEIFWNGRWGTVCDDNFDEIAAQIVCRQLGFKNESAIISSDSLMRSAQRQIWLDDVSCNGTEDRLVDCGHTDFGVTNCGHFEDVAVSCSSALPRQTTVAPAVEQPSALDEELFIAIRTNSSSEEVENVLQRGASPNARSAASCCSYYRPTALICTACLGNYHSAFLLISHGANLELRDRSFEGTAIIWAARAGSANIVSLLIESGAVINAATNVNETALTWAAYSGKYDCVRLLVQGGARVDARTQSGDDAASLARDQGYTDIANYLESAKKNS